MSNTSPSGRNVYGWADCFRLLKRRGFTPRVIIDVGANHGGWTRCALSFFPNATFILVEPQDHLKAHIQDLLAQGAKIRWITAGASDRSGILPLSITPADESSSFVLAPHEAALHGFQQVPVVVRTLSDIISIEQVGIPEMIKIDAEGFDLKALAGASEFFGKTDIFFVEAAVCATLIENTVARVVQAMSKAGYRMIDITDINRSQKYGVLWLCELVFMREGCPLLNEFSTDWR